METFEQTFNSWNLDQKVEWILGPNICNLTNYTRSIIVDLKEENQKLKQKSADDYIEYQNKTQAQAKRIAELENIIKVDDAICITKLEAIIKGKDYAIECYKNERENLEKKIKELESENARMKRFCDELVKDCKWLHTNIVPDMNGFETMVLCKNGKKRVAKFRSFDSRWYDVNNGDKLIVVKWLWQPKMPPTEESSETDKDG